MPAPRTHIRSADITLDAPGSLSSSSPYTLRSRDTLLQTLQLGTSPIIMNKHTHTHELTPCGSTAGMSSTTLHDDSLPAQLLAMAKSVVQQPY